MMLFSLCLLYFFLVWLRMQRFSFNGISCVPGPAPPLSTDVEEAGLDDPRHGLVLYNAEAANTATTRTPSPQELETGDWGEL